MNPDPGERGRPLRIAYVLGTTAGGTGPHVAMLAQGCAARGMAVRVFGPAEAERSYFQGPGRGAAAEPGEGAAGRGQGGAAGLDEDADGYGQSGSAGPGAGYIRGVAAGPDDGELAAGQGGAAAAGRGGAAAAGRGGAAGVGGAVGRGDGAPGDQGGRGRQGHLGAPGFVAVDMAGHPRPAHDLAAVLRLRRLLADWQPDVVHAHGLRAAAFAALARPRRPLVVTVHNAPPAGGPGRAVHAALERLAARRAVAVTWVSGDLAARMRRAGAHDAGRAVVAAPQAPPPGPAQVASARAELGEAGRPVVFAAGRLAEQKGFGVLIEAAARWQGRDPAPLLAIAGTGPLADALAAQARAARVPVRFLGQRADVPVLMAAADVVVVPSLWDGQPLVVQEALRAGRPLVATRAGGIPDLTGEDAALLVPAGDAGALAGAVLSVLDDGGLAARLRAMATQRSTTLPGADDAVDSAVALYRRVLRTGARMNGARDAKPFITRRN